MYTGRIETTKSNELLIIVEIEMAKNFGEIKHKKNSRISASSLDLNSHVVNQITGFRRK